MRAMILAAGRGARMRTLTDNMPKPLLEVAGKPLIAYQLEALARASVDKVVINLGYQGQRLQDYLGDGCHFNINIQYSDEGESVLETGGGIVKALPDLGEQPFIVANADVYTNFDYRSLPTQIDSAAHLILVNNPPHHPQGDFALDKDRVRNQGQEKWTYSGIAVFHPRFFKNCQPGQYPLAPLLRQAAELNDVSGYHFKGFWCDVGTPERLAMLNQTIP